MPTVAKAAAIDELTEKLQRARAAVLLQTEGLTVSEMTELRRRMSSSNVELHVVKNTLLRIASERASYKDISKLLSGQTTIAMSYDDEVAPAKTVSDYLRQVKTGKPVKVKAGILERGPISADQVEALSKVPPREQLRAEVVGAVHGPLNQTYGVLTAPLRDLINVLEARIRQLGGEPAAA
jgi:large subunit ribosomal protein L10